MSGVQRGSSVRIDDTSVGKGVFAERCYPIHSVVGDITGELITDRPTGSSYSIEIDENNQLEPYPPFRFLNHSCDPNCEIDWYDEAVFCEKPVMFVIALRDIQSGEELTIDYHWSADCAIPCQCGSENCRGWIVCVEELDRLPQPNRLLDFVKGKNKSINTIDGP